MWTNPDCLCDIEKALDSGHLFVALNNGNYRQARRNGATRRWKRDPARFYVPIKYGFKGYGYIDQDFNPLHYRIAANRDEAECEQLACAE